MGFSFPLAGSEPIRVLYTLSCANAPTFRLFSAQTLPHTFSKVLHIFYLFSCEKFSPPLTCSLVFHLSFGLEESILAWKHSHCQLKNCEFGERSEEGERWNQKRHQKLQKEEPQLPLNGSLPLSDTQEFTGNPLRAKMAAEGKKPTHALIDERYL
ncbi:hypothetical protein LR48_Vigan530s000100 [Vigna angularis]|uniref:Uncharacterized protein n=1 Tax=Phaseolus angularis TaxID=3914 RepID=A0A0L9TDW1_PHAAN|nr:hypothetical protein LR48_Vigan530s000100 [Vigna angularis]